MKKSKSKKMQAAFQNQSANWESLYSEEKARSQPAQETTSKNVYRLQESKPVTNGNNGKVVSTSPLPKT